MKFGDINVSDEKLRDALAGKAEGEGAGYVGQNDSLVDFGRANSFVDETKSEKRFNMVIKNLSNSDDKKIVLFPGSKTSFTGASIVSDGNFLMDNSTPVLNASGKPGSIAALQAYVKNNPTRLCRIEMKVDNEAQLDESILFRETSPFKSDVEYLRTPSDYISSDTNNPKAVSIDEVNGMVLSDTTEMETTIRAGRTITLSFVFGASMDMTKAINRKADAAADSAASALAVASK